MIKKILIILTLILVGGCHFYIKRVDAAVLQGVLASHVTGTASGVDVSDNFDRANSSPIGGNWSTVTGEGELKIQNNAVTGVTATSNTAYWNANTFSNDICSRVTLSDINGAWNGVSVRVSTSTDSHYDFINNSTSNYQYWKVVNGTATQLGANIAVTPAVGSIITICVSGNTLIGYVNGAAQSTRTDSSLTSGSAGITIYDVGAYVDNWSAWDGGYK